ncbi:MAG: class II aldolase/adducin family protein [Thermoplasmata archaeon]
MDDTEAKRQISDVMRRMYSRNMISTFAGNASARDSTGKNFWITPTGSDKSNVDSEKMAGVSIDDGKSLNQNVPSSEYRLHLAIYRKIDRADAIVHSHAPFTIAAAEENLIDRAVHASYEESSYISNIGIVDAIQPGTYELADSVAERFTDKSVTVVIMKKHGSVAIGRDLYEALNRIEVLEHISELAVLEKLMEK